MKLPVLVPTLLLACAVNAGAGSLTLFDTGTTPQGTVDPHWVLASGPSCPTPPCALYAMNADGFPIPPYVPDSGASQWIEPVGPSADAHPVGDYRYRTTFSLAGFDPATASITGRWMSDNVGIDLLLNGVSTGFVNLLQFTDWSSFTLSSGFVPGINTLDFVVNNAACAGCEATNPTAVRVELEGTATPVPDPGTLTLLGLGLSLVGARLKRRRG